MIGTYVYVVYSEMTEIFVYVIIYLNDRDPCICVIYTKTGIYGYTMISTNKRDIGKRMIYINDRNTWMYYDLHD